MFYMSLRSEIGLHRNLLRENTTVSKTYVGCSLFVSGSFVAIFGRKQKKKKSL